MEKNMKDFLVLVSRAIHGRKPSTFPENADLGRLVETAKLHKLLPLIAQCEKDTAEFASHPVYAEVMGYTLSSAVAQIKRTENFKILYRKMNENGISSIVLKGVVCRNLYGEMGDFRISGDEDILIKKEDFSKTDTFLKKEGFRPDKDDLSENVISLLQEVTYTSPDSDLRLEVHLNPIGKEDLFRRKMNEFFDDVFDDFCEEKSGDIAIRTMNCTKQFLFLIFHAFKHLTVSGFGIRMVCDILLYMEKYSDKIDFEYIHSALKKVNGEGFFADLVFIGNNYLGFSLPSAGEESCPEALLEDILESGIYGNHTQARRTSVHMVHSAMAESGTYSESGKVRLVIDTVFPPKERLLELCPALEKKPWLIFAVYIKRMVRFLSHNKKIKGNLAVESIKIGQKRIELLKKYKLL